MLRTCVIGAALAFAARAHAGGLVVGAGSPRAIGRAGTGTVGDDGGGALLVNPAAMARREGARAQLGVSFSDDEIAWQGDDSDPVARNQSPSGIAPYAAAVGSFASWVIGIAVARAAVSDRALRPPGSLPPDQYGHQFDFRYAGLAGSARHDTVAIGVARRFGETLAVGLSVGASRVAVSETRRMWAGFGGRDEIGSPKQDIELDFDGVDWFVPSAVAGILLAPTQEPIELGASIGVSTAARVVGEVDTRGTTGGPTVSRSRPSSRLLLRQPVMVRVGARYLGARYVLEAGADLWLLRDAAEAGVWTVKGLSVVDPSQLEVELLRVPSRISLRTHGAVRGAVDAELIAGFLWATAGYAYSIGSVGARRQSPTFGDLGGHTVGLGIEATAGGFTLTAGWARTWSVASRRDSQLLLDNPFGAGDRAVPTGVYDGSIDQIGLMIDAELDP